MSTKYLYIVVHNLVTMKK